jgi:uncharacterized protein (DUF2147 family)
MKNLITAALLASSLTLAPAIALAQASPVGLWKTIDDKTKKERSLIRVSDNGGVLSGRIEKRLDADAKPDDKCDSCTDDRKGKPIQGLEIIRGAKKADDVERWDGGSIVDPENGKVYKLRLTPQDGGKTLEVRGFVGMPMLGRSQTWIRVE